MEWTHEIQLEFTNCDGVSMVPNLHLIAVVVEIDPVYIYIRTSKLPIVGNTVSTPMGG